MALPHIPLLNLRGPPCLDENPFTHELLYPLPIRRLDGRELMKIYNELDFIERFTARYSFLFDDKLLENHPHLRDKHNEIIIALKNMQHHGKHSGEHCNAMQLHLLTAANTAEYLTSVKVYSTLCWNSLLPHWMFEKKFKFFEEDVGTLGIMEQSLHDLLHKICPLTFS